MNQELAGKTVEYKMFTPESDIFNQRLAMYMTAIANEEPCSNLQGASYGGGTLCITVFFWAGQTELLLINIDGLANSTIYGNFLMSRENLDLARFLYLKIKGRTDYYNKTVGEKEIVCIMCPSCNDKVTVIVPYSFEGPDLELSLCSECASDSSKFN